MRRFGVGDLGAICVLLGHICEDAGLKPGATQAKPNDSLFAAD